MEAKVKRVNLPTEGRILTTYFAPKGAIIEGREQEGTFYFEIGRGFYADGCIDRDYAYVLHVKGNELTVVPAEGNLRQRFKEKLPLGDCIPIELPDSFVEEARNPKYSPYEFKPVSKELTEYMKSNSN